MINHLASSKEKDKDPKNNVAAEINNRRTSDKDSKDKKDTWAEQVAEDCIGTVKTRGYTSRYMDTLYLAAKGKIVRSAYDDVLSKLNYLNSKNDSSAFEFDNSDLMQERVVKHRTGGGGGKNVHPTTIKNYNILFPVINSIIGARSEVPIGGNVVVKNTDAQNVKQDVINAELVKEAERIAIANLPPEMGGSGNPSDVDLQQKAANIELSYKDKRAVMAQTAINVIKYEQELKDKYQDCLYDYVVCEHAITVKEVIDGDVYIETFDPRGVKYSASEDVKYLEDADIVVLHKRYTLNDIVDKFSDKLSSDLIKVLEERRDQNRTDDFSSTTFQVANEIDAKWADGKYNNVTTDTFDVNYVFIKTLKKVGFLTYIGLLGQEQTMIVDEDYNLDTANGDISIKWDYVTESRKVVRIDDDIYLNYGAVQPQRNELNSKLSRCKHPVNGILPDQRTGSIESIVSIGFPYQVLYNVYHWRLERTISKHKDRLMVMGKGLIPAGWTASKWMYYVEMDNIMWVDEANPKASAFLQAIKSIDMSLGTYIAELNRTLLQVRQEFWDNIGFSPQRLGQTKASETATGVESSINASFVVNGELYRKFDKFIEKDLQGALDYSKVAWKDGKKGTYLDDDRREVMYDIDGVDFAEIEAGIYVKESMKEKEILEKSREYTHAYIQNNLPPDASIDVLSASSTSELKNTVKKATRAQREYEAKMQQMEQEYAAAEKQAEAAEKQAERMHESIENDKDRYKELTIAMIKGGGSSEVPQAAGETVDLKAYNDAIIQREKMLNELEKVRINAEAAKYQADTQLKIAKENRNKYDNKNKK